MLLTLVVPQKDFQQEAVDLLTKPEAIWTVLTINGAAHQAEGFLPDPAQFLTPLAQFVRGICSVVKAQRTNVHPIFEELQAQLDQCLVSLHITVLTM